MCVLANCYVLFISAKGSELTGKQHRKDKYFKGNTEEENSEKIENFREVFCSNIFHLYKVLPYHF